ncbi:hypothetical protein EJ04DRAFT_470224 [Polyplosphaeria fusca]|uniref:Zn(2)-C6 fungal-type domain-containing protein n=1 Tax=Polyplosphaeria fusca TaxID=682080 RepID=A0A9P4V0N2_9PLEO|nr:hypothetical protein EJ04DRAFT_470224 [Polyplosphaeria fusca]
MTRTGFPERLRMSYQARRLNTSYRRNGKLQSCEPCRKGKLRCDHMMPTCGRCARRNKPEQCVYHPAPLTKTNTIPTPEATEASSTEGTTVHTAELNSESLSTLHFPPFEDPPPQARVARASSLPAHPRAAPNDGHVSIEGFLDGLRRPLPDQQRSDGRFLQNDLNAALTSHTAILSENEGSIGIFPPAPNSHIPQSHIDKGALVLGLLKDLPTFEKYIAKWFSLTRGVILIEPMLEIWTQGLWSTWHKTLDTQKQDAMAHMSSVVWANTVTPLQGLLKRSTTPGEFFPRTTGKGLRWEVVGIIFSLVGMLAQSLQDGDPIFCTHDQPPIDRSALALRMNQAAECCLEFCNDFDILNDLYLWFLYEYTVLCCSLHSKGSYTNWQKASYLCGALMAFGLHEEIKVDDNTPFFMAELRKRVFICSYENDKYTSAFVGRPPRLVRQYCRIQLPLDLSDAQLMSDGTDLDNAVGSLDGQGWNQDGHVGRSTFARIFASNALVLEEILEISLGDLPSEEIVRRAVDIESRIIRLWENYPSFLRIDPNNSWDIRKAPVESLFLIYIRLGDLGHHFLLQRTLIKKAGADSGKLLAVSREILTAILVLINNRDSMREFQMDFYQLLSMYGIPSGAVIGVELLHQEQETSALPLVNPLPRSDTVQDLSVLVACLGSIRPDSGGYAICERGRKFLKCILDKVLDPSHSVVRLGSNAGVEEVADTTFTNPLFQPGNDGEFMRWLENMEWEQESWVNFN